MRIAPVPLKGGKILGRLRIFDKRKVTYLISEKCTAFSSTRVKVIKSSIGHFYFVIPTSFRSGICAARAQTTR
jgi:hypothetical protein